MCVRACVCECTLTTDNIDHTVSEKTQITTNNKGCLKSCYNTIQLYCLYVEKFAELPAAAHLLLCSTYGSL